MPVAHRVPSPSTVKELYANAFRCASSSCQRPLYKVDQDTGARTLNSNVSHICARSEGGPRWDATQSEDENRSVRNLLLLCLEHAWEIDQTDRVATFPVALLREWKQQQLDDFDAIGRQGWVLTSEMADEALRASSMPTTINNSVLSLGGTGGNAPGAGGGGGGAFGPNARGGSGGPGGQVRYEGALLPGLLTPNTDATSLQQGVGDRLDNALSDDYRLPSGMAPGAGGGGAGAVGANILGGDGGGGGEQVITAISLEEMAELRAAGFERFEFSIGEGGTGSRYPGEHGKNGGDTVLHCVSADGRILRTLSAAGGIGGRSASAIPPGSREITLADISNGLNVPALLIAELLHTKHGLLYMLGGMWEHLITSALPIDVHSAIACVVSLGRVPHHSRLALFVVVDDPSGQEVVRLAFSVVNEDSRSVANVTQCFTVQFSANVAGIWHIKVVSGCFELARLPLEIRLQAA